MRDLGHTIVSIAQSLGLLDEPCPIRPKAFRYSQSFDDSWSRVPDIARAEDILGFRPRVSLSDGLKFTLAYYGNLISPAQLRRAS
jgi:nucleoside-diphosphate-sugar epimerase